MDPADPSTPSRLDPAERKRALQRGLLATAGALVPILLAVLFVEAAQPFLLIFAGFLAGVFLRLPTAWLRDHTRLPHRAAFGIVLLTLIGIAALVGVLVAPQVANQVEQLGEELPRAAESLVDQLEDVEGLRWLQQRLQAQMERSGDASWLRRALGVFSTAVGALTGLLIVIWAGIYFALHPALYKRGLLALVPKRRQERVSEVLTETDHTLGQWMLGKLVAMAVVGVLTWIGLTALGIPLAFVLSLIAAILTFIPNFGPIASTLPPALLALAQSPMKALWVVLLFLAIQAVESYLITPYIQKQAIAMPPALILISQVILASLFGFLGLLVATPLAAALIVLVRGLYVEDALGKDPEAEPS